MKNFLLFMIILIVILGSSGCSSTKPEYAHVYEKIVKDLTDSEMKGRLTGTEGNKQAENYLEYYFRNLALIPFKSNSYRHTFNQLFHNPDKQLFKLEVEFNDGKRKAYQYGVDYLVQLPVKEISISSPINFDPNRDDLSNYISVIEDSKLLPNVYPKSKAVLVASDQLKNMLLDRMYDVPVFHITQRLYDEFKKNESAIKQVHLLINLQNEEISASNLVGKISGTSGKASHAIVLSAHFDSLGWVQDRTYPGATDNAGGVSALLQLAYNLQRHYQTHTHESDIYIVAFNGEESGMKGSEAFVPEIVNEYDHIVNINIDTVGLKNGGRTVITGRENGEALMHALDHFLNAHAKMDSIVQMNAMSSDHESFANQNIVAASIGQERHDHIHTLDDTPEHVDYEYLFNLVTALFNFVIENDTGQIKPHSDDDEEEKKHEQASDAEQAHMEQSLNARKSLKLGEYMMISDGEKYITITQSEAAYTQLSDLNLAFPALDFPSKLADYSFSKANLFADLKGYIKNEGLKPNQVYRVGNISKDKINTLTLSYKNPKEESVQISIAKKQQLLPQSEFTTQEIVHQNETYQIHYQNANNTFRFTKMINMNGTKYYINIDHGLEKRIRTGNEEFIGLEPDWKKGSEDSAFVLIDKLNINQLVEELVK